MATRFNQNILDAARRLKEARTDATSSGDTEMRYSSALLTTYQNRAILDVVKSVFEKVGRLGFSTVMPEMVKGNLTASLTSPIGGGAGVFSMPVDAWTFLEVFDLTGSKIVKRIDADVVKVINSLDPLLVPSATQPIYYETMGTLVTYPALTSVVGRYIFVHPTMTTASTTDIYINPSYDGEIVDRMVQAGLQDTYKEAPKQ